MGHQPMGWGWLGRPVAGKGRAGLCGAGDQLNWGPGTQVEHGGAGQGQ